MLDRRTGGDPHGARLLDAISAARSQAAYELASSPLEEHFRSRYVVPSPEALAAAPFAIRSRRDRLWAIVPMAEQEPAITPIVEQAAAYLGARLPRARVLFLDGGSCPESVAAARAGGAVVLQQDRIFDAIDWEALLPILNLRRRPAGRAGQGLNVFAAHVVLAALGAGDDDLVFQCDADVRDYEDLAPLERLVAAWDGEAGIRHVKLAQPGRNNEAIMVARAMAHLFSALPLAWVPPAVRELARDVFTALAPDKWLTCGMYLGTGAIALGRPFATGYLDATTQALWTVGAPPCGWRNVRHVECPPRVADAQNSTTKEALMMSSIALFLQGVVMGGQAPHRWRLEDVARLNRDLLPRLRDVPEIGDHAGPVAVHRVEQDRIIPSVRALCGAGLVDLDAARAIVLAEGARM